MKNNWIKGKIYKRGTGFVPLEKFTSIDMFQQCDGQQNLKIECNIRDNCSRFGVHALAGRKTELSL